MSDIRERLDDIWELIESCRSGSFYRNYDKSTALIGKASQALTDIRTELAERDEQEPVATVLTPDPFDERDGVSFSLADWEKLRQLPAYTKLYQHPPAPAAVPEGWMLFPVEAWEFLEGKAPLNGVWFGTPVADDKTGRQKPYWWRSHIRSMLQSAEPASQELRVVDVDNAGDNETAILHLSNGSTAHYRVSEHGPLLEDEPASRSESETKAEALEEFAKKMSAQANEWSKTYDDHKVKKYASCADYARAEAIRLRGEGDDT